MDLRLIKLERLPEAIVEEPTDLLLIDVKQDDGSYVSSRITAFNAFQTENLRLTNIDAFTTTFSKVRDLDISNISNQADVNQLLAEAIVNLQDGADSSSGVIMGGSKPEANGDVPLAAGTLWINTTTMNMYTLVREDDNGTDVDYWVGVTRKT